MTSVRRILLHIGMAKCGSTALQHAFRKHAGALLAQGVLYPEVTSSKVSHKFLAFKLCNDDELPGHFRNLHGGDERRKQQSFDHDWQMICRQVDKHRPHTLLLSTEHLFYGFRAGRGDQLRAVLEPMSPEIHVVAYVRKPSAYYLSAAQQTLKGSSVMPVPAPVEYKEVLEQCGSLFTKVHALPFERTLLKDGDVVSDFIGRFVPDFGPVELRQQKIVNEALSAEAMSLLQDYLRVNHPGCDRLKPLDIRRLIDYLRFVERNYRLHSRPRLLAEVEAYLNHASPDILWLRERHGVQFPGIDYERVGPRANPYAQAGKVSDICYVSAERREEMQLRVLAALLSPRIPVTYRVLAWLLKLRHGALGRLVRRFIGFQLERADVGQH